MTTQRNFLIDDTPTWQGGPAPTPLPADIGPQRAAPKSVAAVKAEVRQTGEAVARARNTDSLSSHLAAARMNAGGEAHKQRERCIDLVIMWPGRTSKELAELGGMDRHAVARRLPEAEEAWQIERRVPEGGGEIQWFPRSETNGA